MLRKLNRHDSQDAQRQRNLLARRLKWAAGTDRLARNPETRKFSWGYKESFLYEVQENLMFDLKEVMQRMQIGKNSGRAFRVLDLSCLEGNAIAEIARDFPNVEAHGLSLRREPAWKNHKNVFWHVGHAQKMPLKGNYFDFVFSHFGITHAPSLESALKELHRILRNGGETAFVLEPTRENNVPHAIEQIARQTGFEVTKHEYKRTSRSRASKHVIHLRKIR
ncbi:MAG: class I SAM-dependent methyltransferase [Candidatus ainarchaeum sp.]|nr:class I SAM-dependent methyltransferase [Candidatus ainarchaeum sp.]